MTDDFEAVVYRSRSRRDCTDRVLVLQALGIAGELRRDEEGWMLRVASADAARAVRELAAYDSENRNWPRPARPLIRLGPGVRGVTAYVTVLLAVAWCQGQDVFAEDWLQLGRAQARAIRNGELWRTVTALTLHLDFAHLAGNIVFGTLFGIFLGQFVGSGIAWLGVLVAAALGNLANAWLQSPWHSSAGASTAVFAALGMLSAYVWKRRGDFDERWPYRWAPIMAGLALLAYTGAGGERTDVGAHLTGFVCGLAGGALLGSVGQARFGNTRLQGLAGTLAFGLVTAAWLLAFRFGA